NRRVQARSGSDCSCVCRFVGGADKACTSGAASKRWAGHYRRCSGAQRTAVPQHHCAERVDAVADGDGPGVLWAAAHTPEAVAAASGHRADIPNACAARGGTASVL
ncbi:hypothetical protein LPJ77_003879, partial [Coemansia sp. RSA 2523]